MNPNTSKQATNGLRRISKAAYLLGFIALVMSIFTIQTSFQVAAFTKKGQNKTQAIKLESGFTKAVAPEFVGPQRRLAPHGGQVVYEPKPAAIPAGTKVNNVSFYGIDLTSGIVAAADTNNDRVPDATENFIASADPDNEIISAFAFNPKSGKFYAGVAAAGGPNTAMGSVLVAENDPQGTYMGTRRTIFPAGKGAIVGMAVIDTPKGDVLLVASAFFSKGLVDATGGDTFSITAYLPGPSGFPDGNQKMTVLGAGATLGSNPINFSFGGMAVDSKNNLYVSVCSKFKQNGNPTLGGAILAFADSDGDGIPDKPTVFAGDESSITASSLAVENNPAGGVKVYALGLNGIFGDPNIIAVYTDANGDLMADGDPATFFTVPAPQIGVITDFGDGTSTPELSHMAYSNGIALFTTVSVLSNKVSDSGVYLTKDDGTGKGGAPTKIFTAPKSSDGNFAFATLVTNVPGNVDNTPPMVKVVSPNGGEMVQGGTPLNITFTSSDDTAVMSHDIALSTDGGNSFGINVATGLAGNVQSFTFNVPGGLNTTMARIRVTARDAAGNSASATSAGNFTIIKAQTGDTTAPTVSISSPKMGDKLNAGSMATVSFTSSDDTAVTAQSVLFAADGTNFTTTLASGLAGNATSFSFRVPTISSTTAAIRVVAMDAAGNMGSATVGSLTVVNDTMAPTVTVTAPAAKAKLKGKQSFTVTFTSADNIGVVSQDVQIAVDGTNFTTLVSGLAGTATSAMVTIPNTKSKAAVIRVIARDAAGNMGMGNSGAFKIKPVK